MCHFTVISSHNILQTKMLEVTTDYFFLVYVKLSGSNTYVLVVHVKLSVSITFFKCLFSENNRFLLFWHFLKFITVVRDRKDTFGTKFFLAWTHLQNGNRNTFSISSLDISNMNSVGKSVRNYKVIYGEIFPESRKQNCVCFLQNLRIPTCTLFSDSPSYKTVKKIAVLPTNHTKRMKILECAFQLCTLAPLCIH